MKKLREWWWEILCLAAYLALAGSQLFIRPIIGLADNGDFPKVLAPLDVCDPNHGRDALQYVYPAYIIDERCHWDSRLASSETLFVILVKQIGEWSGGTSVPISDAGAVHLCVVLAALAVLLRTLHCASPALRFGVPPLVIFIFSDVLYVSYLNSFYMDAASMVFLLLTAALAVAAVMRPRPWVAIAFGVSGSLLALTKTQHAVTGFLFAGLAAWFALRGFRTQWAAATIAILSASVATLVMTPEDYKAEPLYSLIFYALVPPAQNQVAALDELGLPAADLPLAGTHAYSPGAPITTPHWREDFIRQVSYGKLLAYYFHHPASPLRLVGKGLTYFGPAMRPANIANYRREDGFPPGTLAQRFAWWSHLRAWSMFVFPAQMVILYGAVGIAAILCVCRPQWAARWPLYPLVLVLSIAGTVEFLFAVLLDATETARHLFFFHVITEILIICVFACGIDFSLSRLRSNRSGGK